MYKRILRQTAQSISVVYRLLNLETYNLNNRYTPWYIQSQEEIFKSASL